MFIKILNSDFSTCSVWILLQQKKQKSVKYSSNDVYNIFVAYIVIEIFTKNLLLFAPNGQKVSIARGC